MAGLFKANKQTWWQDGPERSATILSTALTVFLSLLLYPSFFRTPTLSLTLSSLSLSFSLSLSTSLHLYLSPPLAVRPPLSLPLAGLEWGEWGPSGDPLCAPMIEQRDAERAREKNTLLYVKAVIALCVCVCVCVWVCYSAIRRWCFPDVKCSARSCRCQLGRVLSWKQIFGGWWIDLTNILAPRRDLFLWDISVYV